MFFFAAAVVIMAFVMSGLTIGKFIHILFVVTVVVALSNASRDADRSDYEHK